MFPREAALSVASAQSILQAAGDGVALAGGAQARREVRMVGATPRGPAASCGSGCAPARRGVAHVFVVDARGRALGGEEVRVQRAGTVRVAVRVPDAGAARRAVVAFAPAGGGTDSVAAVVRGG